MSFSYLTGLAEGSTNSNPFTTSAIDTTGAKVLVALLSEYFLQPDNVITDSKGNTWVALTARNAAGFTYQRWYYCLNPTVGSGHTFSASGNNGSYPGIAVLAFSGTPDVKDADLGNTDTGSSPLSTGSITPAGNNELFVSCLSSWAISATSINSSFNKVQEVLYSSGQHFHAALAYKIQTTGGAENPQWAWTGGSGNGACVGLAAFKLGVAASGRVFAQIF
jgi:hypothetical protein